MKELVYKTIDGNNPRKKEVSIEENDDLSQNHVAKKWICKYFVRSFYESRSKKELEQWINDNKKYSTNKHHCHILTVKDAHTGTSTIVCKVLGEFYVLKQFLALRIIYVNALKISIAHQDKKDG